LNIDIVGTFRNSSIRVKLALLVVLNGVFAFLLAGVFLLGFERLELRKQAAHELSMKAAIMADSSTAALSFLDGPAATEVLAALRSDPDLVEAAIYDATDQPFASYEYNGAGSGKSSRPPPRPRRSGLYFEDRYVLVSQPILLNGQTIGTVFLKAGMNQMQSRLRRYVWIICLVLLVSVALALLLSGGMQRAITEPLAKLSSVARLISVEKDYSVRAVRHGSDEVGFLIDSFNEMLVQIEIREQARRGAEESLRESEERFALAARGANDGLWDWKLSTGQMYLSPRGNQMLGYPEIGKSWAIEEWGSQIHAHDKDRVAAEWSAVNSNTREEFVAEYRVRRRNGTYLWVLARGRAVREESGIAVRIAGSLTDVTEGKIADPLTGLPNRLYFLDRLESSIEAASHADAPFAVLFLDLDGFKLVNDSLGHAAGDELLVEIASRLRSSVQTTAASEGARGSSVVARLGGDEFAILLPGLQPDATLLAERVLQHLSTPFHLGSRQMFASMSVGIALSSSGGTPEDLLRNADTAMYHAKTAGRARFEVFDEGMREQAIARLEIETELRKAIDGEQLVLFYQPQMSIPGRRITGCEALVRWQHPERGLIPPSEFISIAEETDLIVPLGRWVLREACRQMADWQRRFTFSTPLTISVNVSFKQLTAPGFVEDVRRILAQTGLIPGTLRLEMTESTVMTNAEATIDTLRRLKALNTDLEIDDFGTGYSSLSCLSRLPFDTVKIDCSFVRELGTNEESSEIVKAILELARSMSMNVVAEGVETQDQLQQLEALGCTQAQGYYFSKPVGAASAALLFEVEGLKRGFRLIEAGAPEEIDTGLPEYAVQ
jgi:diguanylate cyclase (GGDEF)-like protein/PAS domain S-box-containing protein